MQEGDVVGARTGAGRARRARRAAGRPRGRDRAARPATSARSAHSASKSCAASSSTKASASSAVARALRVDDDERPRAADGAIQAQPPEQARVGECRVRPPRDDEPAAVADLSEGGRARADRLEGEARARAAPPGSTIAPTASASADRLALRLDARLPEAVDERRPRLAQDRGRGVRRLLDARLAALDAGDGRGRPLGEPRVAERACPRHAQPPVGDGRLDVVAGAPAPGARRVSHRPPPPRAARAPRAAARPAPRAPSSASSGVAATATTRADRMPRGDALAGVRDVAHAALQPAHAVADDHVLGGEEHRLARRAGGLALDPRQLAGARPQVRAEHTHAIRGLDRLERGRGARVDLDRPRALAVPDEVDAEQPAQGERARQARADRARLAQQVRRARRRAGAAARRSRTSGSRARRTSGRPTSCSVSPSTTASTPSPTAAAEHATPSMRSCTTAPGGQRAAAPRAHARAAAPAQRLAQPAARAIIGRRGEGARIQQARVAQRRREPLRVAHRAQRLRPVAEQRVALGQPRDERRVVLEARPVDDAARRRLHRGVDQRGQAPARQRHHAPAAASQVEVAEQIERGH